MYFNKNQKAEKLESLLSKLEEAHVAAVSFNNKSQKENRTVGSLCEGLAKFLKLSSNKVGLQLLNKLNKSYNLKFIFILFEIALFPKFFVCHSHKNQKDF